MFIAIKDVAGIRMGVTLRGRDATRTVPSGSCQFVRIGDVSQDGTWVNDNFVNIEPNEPIREDLFLRQGDVLFPNRGTRTTAIAFLLDKPRVIAGSQFFVLKPDPARLLPEYLAWFLRTEEAAQYFDGRRKGSYVQIIQRSDLADLKMPVPPLSVQKKIVEADVLVAQERILSERLSVLRWKCAKGLLAKASKKTTSLTLRRGANAPCSGLTMSEKGV